MNKRECERLWSRQIVQGRKLKAFQGLSQRKYPAVEGYYSHSQVIDHIAGELSATVEIINKDVKGASSLFKAAKIGVDLAEKGCPTYWLDRQIGEALIQTKLPDCNFDEIPLFMNCGLIMLPKGLLKRPGGEDIMALSFSVTPTHQPVEFTFEEAKKSVLLFSGNDNEGRTVAHNRLFISTAANSKKGLFYSGTITLDNAAIKDSTYSTTDDRNIGTAPKTEADFSKRFTHLLINIFCLKAARDHLFTDGEVIGTAPRTGQGFGVKPAKGANEIWSPNWIGRGYEIKKSQPREARDGEQSSRHSPRTHWRSGHQKRVACGVGRTERRIVWIEPTLVMGRAEVEAEAVSA